MVQNAVAYCRFSSDNQREESIDAQLRAIAEYCQANGFILVDRYIDMAISGTTDNRPEFLKMIEDSKKKGFKAVIVHKLDRFARNRYDSAVYSKKLKDNGVSLISVLENLNDSPESVILRSVIEGYNEYYSLNLSRETKKGLQENALKALHCGGTPPLGYDVNKDKRYILNPEEAETVRLIFNMYAQGCGYGEIIKTLNAQGRKTKRGGNFGKNSVYDLLSNEKYIGKFIYRKAESKTNKRRIANSKDVIEIENALPKIIDEDLFKMVQEKKKRNKNVSGGKASAKNTYLLSGIARCGYCGSSLSGATVKRGDYRCGQYRCTKKADKKTDCKFKTINQEKLETFVLEAIKEDLIGSISNPEALKKLNEEIEVNALELGRELTLLEDNIKKLKIKIDNMVNSIAEGLYSEALGEKLKVTELALKEAEIEYIKAKEKEQRAILTEEDLLKVRDLFQGNKNPLELKKLLALILEEVAVTYEGVEITYFIPKNVTANGTPNGDRTCI